MSKLFDVVPDDMFSILGNHRHSVNKNKYVYSDALFVVFDAFKSAITVKRSLLEQMIMDRLQDELTSNSFDDEDADIPEEDQNTRGRAKFLVRKFNQTGWIQFERKENFEEYVNLPDASFKLLAAFSEISEQKNESTFSYVYDTYSSLKQANSEKDERTKYIYRALYGAAEKTEKLQRLLTSVYNNINGYVDRMAALSLPKEIFTAHFDEFQAEIIDRYMEPLKLQESIPKYKTDIISQINDWLSEENLFEGLAKYLNDDKPSLSISECIEEVEGKLNYVKESYEDFELDYIEPIEEKIRRYTRDTTQKLIATTHSNSTLADNLLYLLDAIGKNQDDEYFDLHYMDRMCTLFNP
ncbi:MAG: DUF5716 family protein [Clostridia bacterium]|nr:DUF5716 family protein [Clostridia bacterium]